MGKKDKLAELLFRCGILNTGLLLQTNAFACLSYHRIRKNILGPDAGENSLFCNEVFGPTETHFAHQMRWIKKHMNPLSERDILQHLESKIPLPPKSIMVTFDDGYLDNYTVAYPILKTLGIPATFFIPTDLISKRTLGWWDIIAYLIKASKKQSIFFNDEYYVLSPTSSLRTPQIQSIQSSFKTLKNVSYSKRLQELSNACEVSLPSQELQDKELMTWDQIRELSKNHMQIGSHTHTHRVLRTLTRSQQNYELNESKRILEAQLSTKIESIAIPVGGYEHFALETQSLIKSAGYKLTYSYRTGINRCDSINSLDVKRISVPSDLPRFVGMLTFPNVFLDSFCELKELLPT